MTDSTTYSHRRRAYLRRLGNPYASLQIPEKEPEQLELLSLSEVESSAIRKLGNPYAKLSLSIETTPTSLNAHFEKAAQKVHIPTFNTSAISKAGFRKECRGIFQRYIPAAEKARIRRHHRAFIDRNENRSPTERFKLLVALRKYDIADLPGIQAQFNRERDVFTEDKLRSIERDLSNL